MARYHVISQIIKQHGFTQGAEIGVSDGATFFYLLENHPDLHMVGVDQYKICNGFGDKKTTGFISYVGHDIKKRMNDVSGRIAAEFKNRAKLVPLPSLEAAEKIGEETLDFVFIDGDHRESFVRADIAAWVPKLKKNGLLMGHDCNLPSVNNALKKMFGCWTEFNSSVWLIDKENICFQ